MTALNYVTLVVLFLLTFAVLFLMAGVLGRGWFLWTDDRLESRPRR
jgi:hypothetical protein